MFLEKISNFETVQFILILMIGLVLCALIAARRSRQSEELKSQDQRQKDLIPISQRIAAHKEREAKAGHQLARDF
jgi:K+-sensing histidine kinase KdpD